MKRNKVKLFGDSEIEFYIDEENKDNIIDFLDEKGMDKLRHIFSRICNGKHFYHNLCNKFVHC
jgi:hypothetical protein